MQLDLITFLIAYAGAMLVIMLVAVVFYILTGIYAMKLFRERGVEPAAAWVPYWREWRLFELTGINPLVVLTVLLPVVGGLFFSVMLVIAYYRLGESHQRGGVAAAILGALFGFPPYLIASKGQFNPQLYASRGWRGPFAGTFQAPKPVEFFLV